MTDDVFKPVARPMIDTMSQSGVIGTGRTKPGFRSIRLRQRLSTLGWFVPVLILLALVTIYPAGFVIWMSLYKTQFYQLVSFEGLGNYVAVLSSKSFWRTTQVTLTYTGGSLALAIAGGLATALVVNASGRAATLLRILLIFPWTLSMSVVASIWLWLLNPTFGPIAWWMNQTGFSPGLLLGDPNMALPLTIMVTAWWSFPYAMVMITAAMQSIPKELYEAAEIDGSGPINTFRYITLPHLLPAIGSTAITLMIYYMTLVTLIIVLTGGGPLNATTTLSFQAFRGSVQAVNVAPTAVISVVILLINLLLGGAYSRLSERVSG